MFVRKELMFGLCAFPRQTSPTSTQPKSRRWAKGALTKNHFLKCFTLLHLRSELVLSCSAHGNPSLQYSWSSPGNKNLTTSSIFINSVQSEDQGQYICTAYNDEGSDSVTVVVHVAVDYKLIIAVCAVVGVVGLLILSWWYCYRRTHSATVSRRT
ncbi:carcinoembryonic antigen-related cell adhesion molecule 6-like [Pygocentrus nattereri]|uniref:carcinoembryonic antigen-related cell adhesion molecule 6-like n=1 Tax=Pygocentrus nattereri TaxID=42514 RepID=UPI0018918F00|nr:carcinoembryonic antigen-related cell adhesion molecule 6-like [Pygocentrus nattereri]XP_037399258.1 carcinoembryonic antigen-related cell adhesion molecule 6-like [Pygocentrus nattereri]